MKTTKDFLKEMGKLALPIAFQCLVTQLLYLINNIMVGSLSELNISAVSVSNTFLWLCTTAITGISAGAMVLCAQYFGKGENQNIRKVLDFILVENLGVAFFFFLLISFFAPNIMRIYSNIPGIDAVGSNYLQIMKYSLFFNAISQAVIQVLNSTRAVKIGFFSSTASCIVNAAINYVFIYGRFGMPALGIRAAAFGTLAARFCEMAISSYCLLFIDKNIKFHFYNFNPFLESKTLKMLTKITLPVVGTSVLDNLVSSAQTIITGHISDSYVAANTIVHSSWAIPAVFGWGMASAASIIIGNELGKGDFENVKNDAKRFIRFGFIEGILSVFVLIILIPIISSRYEVSEATLQLAREMGYFACITCVFNTTTQILCNGVIKANGNTFRLLRLDLILNWLIVIPFGYVAAFYLHFPAASLYLILRLGGILKTLWAIKEIKTGKWLQGKENTLLQA